MKIDNTKRIRERILELQNAKDVLNLLTGVVANQIAFSTIDSEMITTLRNEVVKLNIDETKSENDSLSIEKLILILYIESLTDAILPGYDNAKQYYMSYLERETKIFDINEYQNNPYFKNINFNNQVQGDYELCFGCYAPYELSIFDKPIHLSAYHTDIPKIGCFAEKFEYPRIKQKSINGTWMSVTPNEVTTVQPAIDNAKGKVLTLGCGMGYFAYMASLKNDVDSITIIELEQDVIDLFQNNILPQFEHKEKINVIKADAIEFMKNVKDGEYDYCFADIWLSVADIEPYLLVKEVSRRLKKTKIDYWIEDCFASYLSNYVWVEMMKSFSISNHIDVPDTDSGLSEADLRLSNYIHRLMKKVEIKMPEDLDYYLTPKNIIKFINTSKTTFNIT